MQPVDQRVTVTVTPEERAVISYESRLITTSRGTLAEVVRSRAMSSIDWIEWVSAASKALKKMNEFQAQGERLTMRLSVARNEMRRAQRSGDEAGFEAAKTLFESTRQKTLELVRKPVRRSSRLVTRLSYEDRETIAFRAQQLGITISDYMRLLVFSYTPGESDWHMSEVARRRFYHNVLRLAKSGGFPVKERKYACPRCRATLPEQFQK